jgi:hypothetical protein
LPIAREIPQNDETQSFEKLVVKLSGPKEKTGLPSQATRLSQSEIRGFPSPPRNRFGFAVKKMVSKKPVSCQGFFTDNVIFFANFLDRIR